jgi:hypothetical protein
MGTRGGVRMMICSFLRAAQRVGGAGRQHLRREREQRRRRRRRGRDNRRGASGVRLPLGARARAPLGGALRPSARAHAQPRSNASARVGPAAGAASAGSCADPTVVGGPSSLRPPLLRLGAFPLVPAPRQGRAPHGCARGAGAAQGVRIDRRRPSTAPRALRAAGRGRAKGGGCWVVGCWPTSLCARARGSAWGRRTEQNPDPLDVVLTTYLECGGNKWLWYEGREE